MRPQRLYVYKLTTDNLGAPCVWRNKLSLAICKPRIRSTATVGDLIFGFAANSLHPDNRPVYIARITQVVGDGEYYRDPRYRRRPDCIYEFLDGYYEVRPDARYHKHGDELSHDLGPAPYKRATVLMSDDFRYLGQDSDVDLAAFPAIERALDSLARGHRVNHPPELVAELQKLQSAVWQKYPPRFRGHSSESPPTLCKRSC